MTETSITVDEKTMAEQISELEARVAALEEAEARRKRRKAKQPEPEPEPCDPESEERLARFQEKLQQIEVSRKRMERQQYLDRVGDMIGRMNPSTEGYEEMKKQYEKMVEEFNTQHPPVLFELQLPHAA